MNKDPEMPHQLSPMMTKIKVLKEMGYDHEFMMVDGKLKCLETNEDYLPDQVKIVDHFRFEGISDPDDMSIIYSIHTDDGIKGIVIDAFGTYADSELMEFMKKVEDRTVDHL